MFIQDGIVTREMFEAKLPPAERRAKGPYVIMECFQTIPCDPCTTSCKFGAVKDMDDINEIPQPIWDNCSGCARCVSACPGLACFIIDETYSEDKFSIKIPYEMFPLPSKGDTVQGVDRNGTPVTDAEVLAVLSNKGVDKTNVITLAVDKKYLYEVRSIKLKDNK